MIFKPYESFENDGTTLRLVKQFPDYPPYPDEYFQHEFEDARRQFAVGLLEAIMRTKSKVVVEYSEEFPTKSKYGLRSGFQIAAKLTPTKYENVTYFSTVFEPSGFLGYHAPKKKWYQKLFHWWK